MQFDAKRSRKETGQPSLSEMVQKAIEILSKNTEQGFFLMVESGILDQVRRP